MQNGNFTNTWRVLTIVVTALTFTTVGVFLIWDELNGEEERWVRYQADGEQINYEEYTSVDECSEVAFNLEGRFGCRRIDGPFYYIGKVAGIFF